MGHREVIAPDESQRFETFATEIKAIQSRAGRGKARLVRALHVKQHVGAVGTFAANAAPVLRAGVFATDRTYPVYVRFSNGSGRPQADGAPDVRGFAVKLVDVPGTKLIPELADAQTQVFSSSTIPSFPFEHPMSSWRFNARLSTVLSRCCHA